MARERRFRPTFHPLADEAPLIRLDEAVVEYRTQGRGRPNVRAVDGVTLEVTAGHSVGLVGESGCGKTSLGRAILGLAPVSSGTISIGERPGAATATTARRLAQSVQMVFQDPYASLDPRQTIGSAIAEPMVVHKIGDAAERAGRVAALLERVGLGAALMTAYPHQLSGGQRQRVCIARALAVAPLLLVCDEPTSALDVSIQAQVIELLRELQRSEDLTYLFITHDLALLPQFVSDVAVMYLGRIVEIGPVGSILTDANHPYTRSLLEAVPVLGRRRTSSEKLVLTGEAISEDIEAAGCSFRPRCWLYRELSTEEQRRCLSEPPALSAQSTPSRPRSNGDVAASQDHAVACHHVSVTRARTTPRRPPDDASQIGPSRAGTSHTTSSVNERTLS